MKANAKSGKRGGRFHVTAFTNPSGDPVWRVQGYRHNGSRVRANFRTQGEAEAERQRLEIEEGNQAHSVRLAQTRLTTEQLQDAEAAVAELAKADNLAGKSLVDAVRFMARRFAPTHSNAQVATAFPEFILAQEVLKLRPRTIANLKTRVGRLATEFNGLTVAEITAEHLRRALLADTSKHPTTIRNERRAWSSFFAWCVTKRYRSDNPVREISPKRELPRRDQPEPAILTMDEAERFLRNAEEFKSGILLPYTVLALLGGIRPEEVRRLDWSAIDLEAGTVTIQGAHAKTRARRIVELRANAVEFLSLAKNRRTPIVSPNWRKDFDRLKASVGYGGRAKDSESLKPWPSDMLRHTAISVHLAVHEHEGKSAMWAGNSPDIIQRHYKGLLSKSAAEKLYSIRPSATKQGKVIQFATA